MDFYEELKLQQIMLTVYKKRTKNKNVKLFIWNRTQFILHTCTYIHTHKYIHNLSVKLPILMCIATLKWWKNYISFKQMIRATIVSICKQLQKIDYLLCTF